MVDIKDCYEYINKEINHYDLYFDKHNALHCDYKDNLFTLDMLRTIAMVLGSYEQIKWERDLAIEQLNELGYQLGEKIE